ncbi:MAG: GntR family transcriptional regulator [Xenococcaceae cyanobacterium MO_234.B1]|nr:GntR family transcriptional regulator [Xenococcaceae cyanobacterium MO_234.B1]
MNYEALPLYIQIAQKLRESIQQGVYQVEEKLPSEHQLSERFGVNRHTLRRAVSLLKEEGLLRTDKGRGIFLGVCRT